MTPEDRQRLDAVRGRVLTPAQGRWLVALADQLVGALDEYARRADRAALLESELRLVNTEFATVQARHEHTTRLYDDAMRENYCLAAKLDTAESRARTLAEYEAEGPRLRQALEGARIDRETLAWLNRSGMLGTGDVVAFVTDARKRLGEFNLPEGIAR